MFRVLILLLLLPSVLFAQSRATTCYECVQAVDSITCSGQLCGNDDDMPLGWNRHGSFEKGLYHDIGFRYNGTTWVSIAKKRYESGSWIATDDNVENRHYLEPVFLLLLDVMPHRPAFKTLPTIPAPPVIDEGIVPVSCLDATVTSVYTQPAVGAGVSSYLVGLQCADASTWDGIRIYNLALTGKGGLATALLTQNDTSLLLTVELTSFAEFAMVTSIIVGDAL